MCELAQGMRLFALAKCNGWFLCSGRTRHKGGFVVQVSVKHLTYDVAISSAPHVFSVCNWLQVRGVDATRYAAKMVEVKAVEIDFRVSKAIDVSMRTYWAVESHGHSVSALVQTAIPQPAAPGIHCPICSRCAGVCT